MTRTWRRMEGGVEDSGVFTAAGIRHGSDEWGDVYSMIMADSCRPAAECHDRLTQLHNSKSILAEQSSVVLVVAVYGIHHRSGLVRIKCAGQPQVIIVIEARG